MSAILTTVSELIAPYVLAKAVPRVKIEEWGFRLHFRVTTGLLFLCSALLCMRQYIGEHIKCQPHHDDMTNDPIIPRKVVETYCFIATTFTVPYDPKMTTLDAVRSNKNLGGPQYIPGRSPRTHHAYYQWMPFYLFFLGVYFLLTHLIWKAMENGKVKSLVEELNILDLLTPGASKRMTKINSVGRYIVRSKGSHGSWAFAYTICEFLNLGVVLSTMWVTDRFLGREFTMYGPRVVQFLDSDPETRTDPMALVFPRMTKCLFHMFGPSGNIQRFDALCILPSNILNEKIFTFLWFWFAFLLLVTGGSCLYRIGTLISAKFRIHSLLGFDLSDNFPLNAQSVTVFRKLGLSDWFLLRFLKLNLDSETFRLLIKNIYEELI